MIKTIEMYILLFFIYAFAGWCMESIGGILNIKKFVNRGFLIGPYCPVYGFGVVFVNLLLSNYTNDLPVLFILSIVICGSLEYFTSYIMEKLFNARWWDYHNRKFNINGRICLETLIPFGIAATIILKYINPFLFSKFELLPDIALHILTGFLCLIIFIDTIISFIIILSFKGETYQTKDNTEEIGNKVKDKTEEIGNMVKDKTEEALMKASSDAIVFTRRLKVKELKLQRKVRYTRKTFANIITETPREIANRLNKERTIIKNKLIESKEKASEKLENRKQELENIQKDFSKQVMEKFKNKSLLKKRLIEAFPTLKIKEQHKKSKSQN